MPQEIEQKLRREATKKFPNDKKHQNAYVYGTLRHKLGWTPLRIKRKEKGKEGKS